MMWMSKAHAGTETRRGGTPPGAAKTPGRCKVATRAKRLDDLAAEGDAPWKRVDEMIAAKKTSEYDLAVSLLRDLREVAERQDEAEQCSKRVLGIRERYPNRPATALARRPGGRARPAASVATAVSGPGREQSGYQAGAGKNGCGVPLAR